MTFGMTGVVRGLARDLSCDVSHCGGPEPSQSDRTQFSSPGTPLEVLPRRSNPRHSTSRESGESLRSARLERLSARRQGLYVANLAFLGFNTDHQGRTGSCGARKRAFLGPP